MTRSTTQELQLGSLHRDPLPRWLREGGSCTSSDAPGKLRPMAFSSPNLHSPELIRGFLDWFTKNGGYLHSSVEVVYSNAFGHYLQVKQGSELVPGDEIVSCPYVLSISILNAERASPSWPKLLDIPADKAAEILTRFFLIEEYLMQEASFWWPYIRMLPRLDRREFLTTPIWYDEEDLTWIAGTNLEGARLSRLAAWEVEHKSFVEALDERTWNRPYALAAYTL